MPIGSLEAEASAVTFKGAPPELGVTLTTAFGAPMATAREALDDAPAASVTVTLSV